MISTTVKKEAQDTNKSELMRFLSAKNVIIVHPDQHIVAQIVKSLEKTK